MIGKLALRHFVAHFAKNRIVFGVMSVVSCLLFLVLALADGAVLNFKHYFALQTPACDLKIQTQGYQNAVSSGDDWEYISRLLVKNVPELLNALQTPANSSIVAKVGEITSAIELTVFAHQKHYTGFWFKGVDPGHDWPLSPFINVISGEFFDQSNQVQILVHYKAKASMKINPGETVTLLGRDLYGQAIHQKAILKGYYRPKVDYPGAPLLAYINLEGYHLISGLSHGTGRGIMTRLQENINHQKAFLALQNWVREWEKEHGDALEVIQMDRSYSGRFNPYDIVRQILMVMGSLFVIVVCFGGMSVVAITLHDRKTELGTYYCLGSKTSFLFWLYTLEIVLLYATSTFVGLFSGFFLRLIFNSFQLQTEDESLQYVFGGSLIQLGFDPWSLAYIVILMVGVGFLTSLGILRKLLKLPLVVLLRKAE